MLPKSKNENVKAAIKNAIQISNGMLTKKQLDEIWDDICQPDHPTAPLQNRYKGSAGMLETIRANIFNQTVKSLVRNPPQEITGTVLSKTLSYIPDRDSNKKIIPNTMKESLLLVIGITGHPDGEEHVGVMSSTKKHSPEQVQKWMNDIEEGRAYKFSVKGGVLANGILRYNIDDTCKYESSNVAPVGIEFFEKNINLEVLTIAEAAETLPEAPNYDALPQLYKVNVDYAKPVDKEKFKGGVLSVSDLTSDPQNKLHRTSVMATYYDAFKYGQFSMIYAVGYGVCQPIDEDNENTFSGVTINANFIVPIAVMENTQNIKTTQPIPENAVDAADELAEIENGNEESSTPSVDCDYFGFGYEANDKGCQSCPVKEECEKKSKEEA